MIPLRLDRWMRSLVHCGQFTITMLVEGVESSIILCFHGFHFRRKRLGASRANPTLTISPF
jgi:hypothetical protein